MGEEDSEDEAIRILDTTERFPTGTYVDVDAYRVPISNRYPEGIKYSFQYGDPERGTIIRYDNFPDHPNAPTHHKHTDDGRVVAVDFDGVLSLYDRFKQEVQNHGEPWH